MLTSRILLACIFGFLGGQFDGSAAQTKAAPNLDRAALYRLLDEAGYASKFKGRFLCLEESNLVKGVRVLQSREYGFELPKGKHDIRLFTANLFMTERDRYDESPITLREIDFRSAMESEMLLQKKFWKEDPDWSRNPDESAPWYGSLEPFVWSRVAALKGDKDLSDRLFAHAEKLASSHEGGFLPGLVEDISMRFGFGINQAIADGASYESIRKDCERYLELFSNTKGAPLVKGRIASIMAMPEADRTFAARPKLGGDEDIVALLIHGLTEQTGRSFHTKGGPVLDGLSFFGIDYEEAKPTNAARLKKLGLRAVPQLMEALTDIRLTRTVTFNYSWPHDGVLKVGDAAEQILYSIAPVRESVQEEDWLKGKLAAREIFRKWWAEVERKGERAVLIEGTATGDEHSPAFAAQLAAKHPGDVVAAVAKGIGATKDINFRVALLRTLDAVKTQEAQTFVARFLTDSSRELKLEAARILLDTAPELCYSVLQREFQKDYRDGDVITLLLSMKRIDAIELVFASVSKQSDSMRYQIQDAIGDMLGNIQYQVSEGEVDEAQAAPILILCEKILVSFLTDTDREVGLSGGSGDYSYEDPRICDMAAYKLSSAYPEKYKFEQFDSPRAMDKLCISMANIWRAANGLAPLPLPTVPRVTPADPEKLEAALDTYLADPTDVNRQAILKMGLGALNGTVIRANRLTGKDRSLLDGLAVSLSMTVRLVAFQGPVPEKVRSKVEAWRDSPLTEHLFVGLMAELHSTMGPRSAGFRFEADREGDGTGITIRLTYRTPDLPADGTQLDYTCRAVLGAERLLSYSGGGTGPFAPDNSDEEWSVGLKKIFAAPPTKIVHIFHEQYQVRHD